MSKLPLEYRLDQKHAAGSLQELMARASFFATVLARIDRNHLSVQRAGRIFLADELARLLACSSQTTQPREPTPYATVSHRGASFRQGMVLPVVIHQGSMLVADGFPVRLVGPQEILRFVEKRFQDKLFATQGERGDSR